MSDRKVRKLCAKCARSSQQLSLPAWPEAEKWLQYNSVRGRSWKIFKKSSKKMLCGQWNSVYFFLTKSKSASWVSWQNKFGPEWACHFQNNKWCEWMLNTFVCVIWLMCVLFFFAKAGAAFSRAFLLYFHIFTRISLIPFLSFCVQQFISWHQFFHINFIII